jgi:hypothetical protein
MPSRCFQHAHARQKFSEKQASISKHGHFMGILLTALSSLFPLPPGEGRVRVPLHPSKPACRHADALPHGRGSEPYYSATRVSKRSSARKALHFCEHPNRFRKTVKTVKNRKKTVDKRMENGAKTVENRSPI